MKQLYKVGGEGPDPAALFQATATNPKQSRKDKSAMPRCWRAGVMPDFDGPELRRIRDNAKQVNERHQPRCGRRLTITGAKEWRQD